MDWFVMQFGIDRLHADVVLPTDDYFPGVYRGAREDVRSVLDRLCTHMGIDPDRVELEHDAADGNPQLSANVPIHAQWRGAAGHHRLRDGQSVIEIRDDQAARPMALVATIAHELGHVLLLGDRRISGQQEDQEPLTDLLTVFFGLGIFTANAAFEYAREAQGAYSHAHTSRLGYLTDLCTDTGWPGTPGYEVRPTRDGPGTSTPIPALSSNAACATLPTRTDPGSESGSTLPALPGRDVVAGSRLPYPIRTCASRCAHALGFDPVLHAFARIRR